MRVRARARQKGVELPLIISDHADWNELTGTIAEVNPQETWITHGREEALLRWCELNPRRARALALRDHGVARAFPVILSFFCGGVPSQSGAEAVLSEVAAFCARGGAAA